MNSRKMMGETSSSCMAGATRVDVDIDEWRHFDDCASENSGGGAAPAAEIQGRCADCWGPAVGQKDRDNRWLRIHCRVCGRSLDGEEAERESESMRLEGECNMPRARMGRGSQYRGDARFVLKILPQMARDPAWFEQRLAARLAVGPRQRYLDRQDFPPGTAGYLYAQARALLSGLETLPREMSAIALSDLEFGKPEVLRVDASAANTSVRLSAAAPATYRRPSDSELMARMGSAMLAGMTASFACEVGMKAILMTRLDEAQRTHDLLLLYKALPGDSRERLEADFAGIREVLEGNRHTFGNWRYFEAKMSSKAIEALANTDRVWGLAKAGRVILDECAVAGLDYEVHVQSEFNVTADRGHLSCPTRIDLSVVGTEAPIRWDQVLNAGRDRLRGATSSK